MDVDCGSARDRLGQVLGGKYCLKDVLGAGGTAVVFRAEDQQGHPVAVKMLHDHLSHSEEVCRRFVREGQLGNVLDHPGTVRVFDHGSTEDGCPYLVLEFLEGESLEERRERLGGRLELTETLALCDELLAVLEIAHAKSIVHRDIKPSNLFLTKAGQLKVLDFGIARLVDDRSSTATKTGQMVGTPAFMPPEQALSRPREVDARTDLWSVGATLFTLLSGEHVHTAESSAEHLVKAATLHARSLSKALSAVPTNVEALVAKSLAFDKNERWTSASQMRAALAHVRENPGGRIGISAVPPPEHMSDPKLPSYVTGGEFAPPPSSRRTPVGVTRPTSLEGNAEVDATMSISSNPGGYDLVRPKRRWLLPLAVGSSALLVVLTVIGLTFVTRSAPAAVAIASTGTQATAVVPPPPPIDPPSVTELSAAPVPAAATAAPQPTPHHVAAAAPAPKPPVATGSGRKPPRKDNAGSRKDLYKPF